MPALTNQQHEAAEWLAENSGILRATPGSGKTRTTLMMLERTNRRALIVAPAAVVANTWSDEAKKINTRAVVPYMGTPKKRNTHLTDMYRDDTHVIASFTLACEILRRAAFSKHLNFDTIVFDEIHLLRNINGKLHKKLRDYSEHVEQKIGLTGTPAPNHLVHLYGQLRLTKPLKTNKAPMLLEQWHKEYFVPFRTRINYDRTIINWVNSGNTVERVAEITKDRVYDMHVDFGVRHEVDHKVEVDAGVFDAADRSSNLIVKQQIAQGRIYTYKDGVTTIDILHRKKQDALADLLRELDGEPTLVYYQYDHDVDAIKEACNDLNLPCLIPRSNRDKTTSCRLWNEQKLSVLALHPGSAAHGLNLQYGGRTIIWYAIPIDAGHYEQGNRRLQRQGGVSETILVHRLIAKGSIDKHLLDLIEKKETTQQQYVDNL